MLTDEELLSLSWLVDELRLGLDTVLLVSAIRETLGRLTNSLSTTKDTTYDRRKKTGQDWDLVKKKKGGGDMRVAKGKMQMDGHGGTEFSLI